MKGQEVKCNNQQCPVCYPVKGYVFSSNPMMNKVRRKKLFQNILFWMLVGGLVLFTVFCLFRVFEG